MGRTPNICAGPFGALYSLYVEPGGRLVGTTFLAGGTRRAQALLGIGARRGHPLPPAREDLLRWLTAAGIADAQVDPQPGFAAFSGRRA